MIVLYHITLVPLTEELRDADPTLLSPFYASDAKFDGLARRSAAQLHLLMENEPNRGYFPEPDKLLLLVDNSEDKEVVRQELEQVVLNLNYLVRNPYLGA